ncbi:Cation efflux system protein CusB precursor [Phycisphaerae bacterium RAS2]|nr:Cation efflux system protein CusB precursor [Phycisphaerae bacterium RAS2]
MTTSSPMPGGEPPRSWPAQMVYSARRMRIVRVLVLTALWLLTIWVARCSVTPGGASGQGPGGAHAAAAYWTCSMHPHIKLPEAGQCPICFMDLIPVRSDDSASQDLPIVSLSPRARRLAKVETAKAQRRALAHDIHMVGKIAPDETRITFISSYIPGRLDRLYVDYTGIPVRKGDHLAEIYSPDLLVAQREFLLALEALDRSRPEASEAALPREAAQSVFDAARRKLELWGIPADEIARLQRDRQPSDHMRIDSPVEGWVSERQSYRGMYVETGTRLFTVVDLKRVWVMLDAYEMDVPFIRHGQSVQFETESVPGRAFEGRVAYVDPVLNETTRTVRVRLNIDNDDLLLRPGMFVRARLMVRLADDGRVASNDLAGHWVCPMHPEVVRNGPAMCDQCGMALVPAESAGYASTTAPSGEALAVPSTAVLLTGHRAVVYVQHQRGEQYEYEGRVVELGLRAGDWYIIQSGLKEGEEVVTRGALQIDSAVQIQARPSMMQPAEPASTGGSGEPAAPPIASRAISGAAYHKAARGVIEAYLDLAAGLAADDLARSRLATTTLHRAANEARATGLAEADAAEFDRLMKDIAGAAHGLGGASIEELRDHLAALSGAVETYLRTFGHDRPEPLFRTYCPMAFENKGAYWLQARQQIDNPYFGAAMLRCGEVRAALSADGKETK